jgi:hypothetical protein
MLQSRAIRNSMLAALLPLLFLNAGSARALYRCVFDGVARSECCCPPAARPHAVPDSVSRASCCDFEQPGAAAVMQARVDRSEVAQLRAPVALLALPRLDFASSWTVVETQRLRAGLDPPPGPPLLLLKRSFLI